MQALNFFSVLAYENTQVSMTMVNGQWASAFSKFSWLKNYVKVYDSFVCLCNVSNGGGGAALTSFCPNDAKG